MTNIFQAVRNNNIEEVINLSTSAPDLINTRDGDKTLLSLAVENGSLDMVQTLVSRGADINHVYGPSHALTIAINNQDNTMIELLLNLGADVNQGDVLLALADNNNIDLFNTLVQRGLRADNINGYQALQIASKNDNIAFAQSLLAANVLTSSENGEEAPLINAINNGNIEMVALLVNTENSNVRYLDMPALIWAAKDGRDDIVNILLEHNASVNISYNSTTALMWAFHKGHPEVARVLINAGADFLTDLTTHYTNQTNDATSFALFLKDVGADLNIIHNEETPLMTASGDGVANLVTALIHAGADLDLQDNNGNTALMLAIMEGRINIAAMLINSGANLDMQDNNGNTALIIASAESQINIVEMLINNNAACLDVNNIGLSALDYVNNIEPTDLDSQEGKIFIISALQELITDINDVSNFLYNNIARGVEITANDYASLQDFYEINKKDIALNYTNIYYASPNFVNAEIVIKQAYQAIQSNYLSIVGVSKEGIIPGLNADIENNIFSFLVSKEISDGASKTLTHHATTVEHITTEEDTLPNSIANHEEAEEIVIIADIIADEEPNITAHTFTTPEEYNHWRFGDDDDNHSPLKRQKLSHDFAFNADENDNFANLVGIAAPADDAMDIA